MNTQTRPNSPPSCGWSNHLCIKASKAGLWFEDQQYPIGTIYLHAPFMDISGAWITDLNGRLVSQKDYPDLFAVIGYTYGNSPVMTVKTEPKNKIVKWFKGVFDIPLKEETVSNPNHVPGMFGLPDFQTRLYRQPE